MIREQEPPRPSTKLSTRQRACVDLGNEPRYGTGKTEEAGARASWTGS